MAKKHGRPLPKAAEPFRFKPGQSGNPKGRPLNPIPKALRELTVQSYREVIEAVCTGNMDNLQAMIKDPKVSALQVGVATSVIKAIQNGDYAVIERIAERIVGKIPEELNVRSQNQSTSLNINSSIDEAKMQLAFAKLQEKL